MKLAEIRMVLAIMTDEERAVYVKRLIDRIEEAERKLYAKE